MKWMLTMIVVIGSSLHGTTAFAAEEVTAVARLDSTTFLIGDPIRVSATIHHPKGTSITPLAGETLGSFTVLQAPVLSKETDTTTSGYFAVARYDSGSVFLPPVPFAYTLPGDTLVDTVKTEPLGLTVYLAEVDTAQPIKDLKPPIGIPMSMEEIALITGIILILLAGAFFLYRMWWKRREAPEGSAPVIAQKPAHVVAFEELADLKEKRLWQQGLTKEFYSELTEILRRYFENRYAVSALEQTTDEIIMNLRNSVSQAEIVSDIEKVLVMADLVKFAKLAPSTDDHEVAFSTVYSIVEKTRVVQVSAVPQPGKEVEEYARV